MTPTLIFKLYAGGYCNQLFSLETAIYLANVTKRKLILWIKHPLLHVGYSSWDHGYIIDFFSKEFLRFLPYGFQVYYGTLPIELRKIIRSKSTTHITNINFSAQIFVDYILNTDQNNQNIHDFAFGRYIRIIDWNKDFATEYLFTDRSNASRCYYNFYTTKQNYNIMDQICTSLTKYNTNLTRIIESIKIEYPYNAIHCRFGDPNDPITRLYHHKYNLYVEQITKQLLKNNKLIIMSDITCQKPSLLKTLESKFQTEYIEKILPVLPPCSHNPNVLNFIVSMHICARATLFSGTNRSTVSNYIQYLRDLNGKTACYYFNRPVAIEFIDVPWIKCSYKGPPTSVSWHVYWGKPHKWQTQTNLIVI